MDRVFPTDIFNPHAPLLELPRRMALVVLMLLITAATALAQVDMSVELKDGDAPRIVDGESTSDVFGLGQSVVVRGSVRHGVLAFGGDVIVEGRVEGDVAAIGGSVYQREGSYIGGDVLVFGGAYHHGKTAPGRRTDSRTIMFAGYEEELRQLARNPASLLTPSYSAAYFGQRLLAILFWFIVSLALTAISPGAVSRAAARLQLTSLRVAIIGLVGAFVVGPGTIVSLKLLPPMVGTLVGIMALSLLFVAYLFGRVVVHAVTGRWLQRLFLPENRRSEAVALLLGAAFWSAMLAVPYIWPFIVAALLMTSLGLALTARYRIGWKRA